jgi:O-antigen/teichoic acid export membrane protein
VGISKIIKGDEKTRQELIDTLVIAARKIYKIITILATFLLYIGGSLYIIKVLTPQQDKAETILSWMAYAGGYLINFYYGYFNGLLQGRGDVVEANKITILTRATLVIFGATSVMLGFGILGLGIASLLSSLTSRWAAHYYFYTKYTLSRSYTDSHINNSLQKQMISTLWHNASRLGLVNIGAFLIIRGNILIVTSYLGLVEAASYGATITILITLSSISMVICQIQIPYMSILQAKDNIKELSFIYGEILLVALGSFIGGLLILLFFGNNILFLLNSKTMILGNWPLTLLGFVFLLELNHSIAGAYLTTTNYIPFVSASLFSGVAVFILSIILIEKYGIIGVICSQGVVQLLYNNWKWPSEVRKHINVSNTKMIFNGFKSLKTKMKKFIGY